MSKRIQAILLETILFITLDSIFFAITFSHFNKVVHSIQGNSITPNIPSALAAYVVLIGGLHCLVVEKMEEKFNISNILSLSVPYALAVYGTFDFTTATIFDNWDIKTCIMDVIWGVFNCSATAIAVAYSRQVYGSKSSNPEKTE